MKMELNAHCSYSSHFASSKWFCGLSPRENEIFLQQKHTFETLCKWQIDTLYIIKICDMERSMTYLNTNDKTNDISEYKSEKETRRYLQKVSTGIPNAKFHFIHAKKYFISYTTQPTDTENLSRSMLAYIHS